MVNEHFFDERNAAGGHYGQTLIKKFEMMEKIIRLCFSTIVTAILGPGCGENTES